MENNKIMKIFYWDNVEFLELINYNSLPNLFFPGTCNANFPKELFLKKIIVFIDFYIHD